MVKNQMDKGSLTREEKIALIKNYLDDDSICALMQKTDTELEEQIDINLNNILLKADCEVW